MNKTILISTLSAAILTVFMACQKANDNVMPPFFVPAQSAQPVVYAFESTPLWQDEFDNAGAPDSKNWDYDTGGNGWGNKELQNYTRNAKNARVENGKLIIEAHNENSASNNYSSARLITKNKRDWTYGKFEIRAKIPQGTGTWPAIWMLATNQTYGTSYWPDNGEIDIMEHVGFDPTRVHGNIHTKAYNHSINTNKGNSVLVPTALTDFHVYTTEWTPESIKILVDDKDYFTFKRDGGWQVWPFDKPFHLIMNIAVGGEWGGQKGVDNTIFPQRMEIDYVRVYALKK